MGTGTAKVPWAPNNNTPPAVPLGYAWDAQSALEPAGLAKVQHSARGGDFGGGQAGPSSSNGVHCIGAVAQHLPITHDRGPTTIKTDDPLMIAVPAYPPLAPPFPQTWQLNRSTIIHTSNKSGWTDTASAARYGIISFDAQNAEALWLTPNRSECTAEEALIEQARQVKAVAPSTKVLVYRNVMWALQWLSSQRVAMEDPTKAHYFLRYPVPTPTPTAAAGNIYYTQAHEGNQYLWNYSNPEAVKYFMEEVVMGEGGVGSPHVDGMFFGK